MLTCFFAVGGLAGLGGVLFLNREAVARELHNWQVLPQPEALTELYFTHPRQLDTICKSDCPHEVQFTAHNLEHRAVTYHYKIVAISKDDNRSYLLGNGRVMLVHDQSRTVSQDIILPPLTGRTLIRIILSFEVAASDKDAASVQSQSIHYWIDPASKGDSAE